MIHYHGIPFSGETEPQMALVARHACASFAKPGPLKQAAELCQSFILDNGAFTAWKAGKPLDVSGYIRWVTEWYRHPGFDWCLIPDIIDGTEGQNEALVLSWPKWLADVGVPVWHLHESLDYLRVLSEMFPRVAIGSSGDYSTIGTRAWWGRMAEAMDTVCDDQGRPRAKLHGLRMLDPTVFSHFPFASADSTNVARNIGIDSAWKGPYAPITNYTRARILMERIESHASAARWTRSCAGKNEELFG